MRITQLMIGEGFGGGERLFVDLAISLAQRGHHVQVVCHPRFVKRSLLEGHSGLEITPVKVRSNWDLWGIYQVRQQVRRFAPDVVNTHMSRGAFVGGWAVRPLGIPIIATLHNYTKLKYYRQADAFIGTTPDQRNYLLNLGVDDERIAVVPNFARFSSVEAPRPVPATSLRFVTCGRLHHVKGYDILLRAFRQLIDDGRDARLAIGGDGPEREPLVALCRDLGLQDRVEFCGWIDNVAEFLDRYDVFVLSSRAESFGIALLEAMSRGLPIVTTRAAGPMQVLDSSCAIFADPDHPTSLAAAMRQAIDHPDELTALAFEGIHRYRTLYTEEACVPLFVDFAKKVVAGAPWPPR